ncbi:hypothetical protein SAMN05444673_6773 [Bacillus sp. OV166]|uniref:DUF7010 family protein n=1 Tax=Bacillus sp. OV166 TaxID=1882763 RepID=UPI000A2AD461|nr:hypothetical protein [Bacillus sp. OV166]SMQ86758.1 hypothetical protein SAMN05444673_6773 [Bacillus sp. OV166]
MSQTIIPRAAVRGTASGVLFMAFFGTLWAGIGIRGLQGWGFLWLLILSLLIGVLLLIGGIKLIKNSRRLSNAMMEGDATRRSKRMGMMFGIIFGLEGLLIAAASAICSATNHLDLFVPVMALIVGAHFFPLAHLFRVRIHYIAGTLLCLLATITLLTLPVRVTLGHHQIEVWWATVGFGSALILWGTGVAVWLTGLRLLKRARNGFKEDVDSFRL